MMRERVSSDDAQWRLGLLGVEARATVCGGECSRVG